MALGVSMLALALALRQAPTGPSAVPLIPLGAGFVALGDSLISQKSNARSIDNPVALLAFDLGGFLRPRPGADQGIGGQRMDQMLARVAFTARQRPDVVFLDGGTNDLSAGRTVAQISADDDAICAAIWAENPAALIVRVGQHVFASASGKASQIAELNAYLASKQNIAGATGRYLFVPIPEGFTAAAWTYDGTHWNAYGARQVANAIGAALRPLLGAGDLFADAGAAAYYGANLDGATALAGTGGTATGLQAGSQVATGKSVVLSGLAGGTAAAAKGEGSQIITLSAGNATSAGTVTFGGTSIAIDGQPGQFFEHFAWARITAADGVSPPVGLKNLYEAFGAIGYHFAPFVSAVDDVPAAMAGAFRVWPLGLRAASSSIMPTIVLVTGTGAVDIRIEIAMPRVRRSELTAYAPPLYLGADGIKGATETLRITGTAGVGNVLTGEPGTWSGGAIVHSPQWYRDGAPIAGATGWSYTQVAADSGHAITFGTNPANWLGSDNGARSAAVNVP